jgi:hypothetical protein
MYIDGDFTGNLVYRGLQIDWSASTPTVLPSVFVWSNRISTKQIHFESDADTETSKVSVGPTNVSE